MKRSCSSLVGSSSWQGMGTVVGSPCYYCCCCCWQDMSGGDGDGEGVDDLYSDDSSSSRAAI